ncbi:MULTISPECIES: hypothetical protein [unclassified Devosia]|uniref:hypothetical protein n=1 Tax=unclassified Devosia TaxID=196773 RepID=UPI0015521846|nr:MULTISPECIES: hypothetical protein [unclassified Devosia]
MSILLGVVALFALLTLIVAVVQAMAMVRLAAQPGLASLFPFGWWKFSALEVRGGARALPHLRVYKRAVIAFLVFVVLGLMLSSWAANTRAVPTGIAALSFSLASLPAIGPAALSLES